MVLIVTHLAAVVLGAGLVLAASALTAAQTGRTERYLQRQDARARGVLEADRSRWSNLALSLAQGRAVEMPMLTATAPAQPPPPDPDLTPPAALDAAEALARYYTSDPNELPDPEQDAFDDAALRTARH